MNWPPVFGRGLVDSSGADQTAASLASQTSPSGRRRLGHRPRARGLQHFEHEHHNYGCSRDDHAPLDGEVDR